RTVAVNADNAWRLGSDSEHAQPRAAYAGVGRSTTIVRGSSPTPAIRTRTARAGSSGSTRSAHSMTVMPSPSIISSIPRSISSARLVVSSAPIGEPAERLAQRVDDVVGDERLFAHALGGDVPGEAVQIDAGRRRLRRVDAAREQRAEDPGQHVARSAARHAGVTRRI